MIQNNVQEGMLKERNNLSSWYWRRSKQTKNITHSMVNM